MHKNYVGNDAGTVLSSFQYLMKSTNAELMTSSGVINFGNQGTKAGNETLKLSSQICQIIQSTNEAYSLSSITPPNTTTLTNAQAYMVINAFCLGAFQQLYPKAIPNSPNIGIKLGKTSNPTSAWSKMDTPCFPGALYTVLKPSKDTNISKPLPKDVKELRALLSTLTKDAASLTPNPGLAKSSRPSATLQVHQLEGYLLLDKSGYYEFGVNSDGASAFFIGDTEVASWFEQHVANSTEPGGKMSKIYLRKGMHRFSVYHFPDTSATASKDKDNIVQVLYRRNPVVTPSWASSQKTNDITSNPWTVWPENKIAHSLRDYSAKFNLDIAIGLFMTDWVEQLFSREMENSKGDTGKFFSKYLSADTDIVSAAPRNLNDKVSGQLTDRTSIINLQDVLQTMQLDLLNTKTNKETRMDAKSVVLAALTDTLSDLKMPTAKEEAQFLRLLIISFLPAIHFRSLMALADYYRTHNMPKSAVETDIAMANFACSALWMLSQGGCGTASLEPQECAALQYAYRLFGIQVLNIGQTTLDFALGNVTDSGKDYMMLENRLAKVNDYARSVELDGSVKNSLDLNVAMERRKLKEKVGIIVVVVLALAITGILTGVLVYGSDENKFLLWISLVLDVILIWLASIMLKNKNSGLSAFTWKNNTEVIVSVTVLFVVICAVTFLSYKLPKGQGGN